MSGDMLEGSLRGKTAAEAWLRAHPTRCVAAEDAMEDFKPHVILCGTQASGPALRYEMNFAVPTVFIFLFKEGVTEFRDHVDFEPPRPSLFAVHPWLSGELDAPSRNLHQPGGFVLEESVSEDDISQDGPWHELHRFIQAGPPPVAIGWGSMIANGLPPSAMLELALDVLRLGCRRGVVIGGWARLQHLGQQLLAGQCLLGTSEEKSRELADFASANVYFVESIPHVWLLPQCSCFIHHGGAGTLHSAIRAGVPSVVTPIFGDQFESAAAAQRLSAGYGFDVSLPEISAEDVAVAVELAEQNTDIVQALAKELLETDGAQQAAAILDSFLHTEVMSGRWGEQFQVLWRPRNIVPQ